jgi:hypothetical protein
MRKYYLGLAVLFVLPAVTLLPQKGKALYHFAALEGTRCSTCHVNPGGGMLRSQVGIDYAQYGHSFGEPADAPPSLNFFIGDNLQAGSDMRFLYDYEDTTDLNNPSARSRSTFFTMQGALYLAAYLGPRLVLFYNNDFGFGGIGQSRELWGMLRKLPYGGYLKAGRFKLPYGIRLDDHTSFIKDRLGFGNRSQDNGLEIGFEPCIFYLRLALTNGEDPALPFDNNTYKAFTSSAGFFRKNFSLGASYHFNRTEFAAQERHRAGLFGSASIGNLIVLGEIDYGWNDSLSGFVPPDNQLMAGYLEGIYNLVQDVWLSAKLDYFDPQRGRRDDDLQRISLGGRVYGFKFSELRLS